MSERRKERLQAAHTSSAPLRALFDAPPLFAGRHTILKNSQDQIQQSFPRRIRINKNTSPPGTQRQPSLPGNSEKQDLYQSVRGEVAGPAPTQVPARNGDLHLVSVSLANRMGRGRWASGQAGVCSEGNRAFCDCKHSNRNSCL